MRSTPPEPVEPTADGDGRGSTSLALTAFLVRHVMRGLAATYRYRFLGFEGLDDLATAGGPAILTLWHEAMLLSLGMVLRLHRQGLKVAIMASHSRDGELAARVARPWGVQINRGSTSRGGLAGMRGLHRDIVRRGWSPMILPDGPRGPAHEVKPGVVVLAQMSQAPIVPLAFAARRFLRIGSWDRMFVAAPATTIAVAIGEPRRVPRQLDDPERERLRQWVGDELERLGTAARARLV